MTNDDTYRLILAELVGLPVYPRQTQAERATYLRLRNELLRWCYAGEDPQERWREAGEYETLLWRLRWEQTPKPVY